MIFLTKSNKTNETCKNIIDYAVVNANVRKYREKAKLTQAQLAEKSHISPKYLSRLENNYYNGHLHIYVQIAIALNITIYDLIGNTTDTKNDFVNQIELLTRDMADNQKDAIFESIKLIKKYNF